MSLCLSLICVLGILNEFKKQCRRKLKISSSLFPIWMNVGVGNRNLVPVEERRIWKIDPYLQVTRSLCLFYSHNFKPGYWLKQINFYPYFRRGRLQEELFWLLDSLALEKQLLLWVMCIVNFDFFFISNGVVPIARQWSKKKQCHLFTLKVINKCVNVNHVLHTKVCSIFYYYMLMLS